MSLLAFEEAVRRHVGRRLARSRQCIETTHRDPISVFLTDALSFRLALLEGVLVLELGSHGCWLLADRADK